MRISGYKVSLTAQIGIAIVAINLIVALFAPLIAPFDPVTPLGDAWADGRVSVAGEHAASHAVFRRLAAAYQAAGRSAPAERSILVGLPPGARHELGAAPARHHHVSE